MFKLFRVPLNLIRRSESKPHIKRTIYNYTSTNFINGLNSVGINKSYAKNYSTQGHTGEDQVLKEIIEANPDLEHKVKVLILEVEVMRQDGRNVPSTSFMRKDYWEELLKLGTRTGRWKYLNYLFKLEKKKENIQLKKAQRQLERENLPKPVREDGHIVYSLSENNILLRVYDTTMNHFYNSRLIQAMMFGQQLVVDCGYDKEMTKRENLNCAKQLMFLFSDNRIHEDPFDLHFCNLAEDSFLSKAIYKHIPTMYEPWFPLHIHQGSYNDLFPKEKLIYLTPDSREEMLQYDHDAIYIIGGIVDKAKNDPLSLAKAKKQGLKMLKLPLDRYLNWGSGSGKNLTLNQIISVLLDIKRTGDWNYALRHVPKRKIAIEEELGCTNIRNSQTLRYDKDDRRVKGGMKHEWQFNKSRRPSRSDSANNNEKINLHIKSIRSK